MTLRQPAETLTVSSTPPEIIEQHSLITQIWGVRRYNRTHRRKHTLAIRMRCVVTDATGHHATLTLETDIS